MNYKIYTTFVICLFSLSCENEKNRLINSYIKHPPQGMVWISGGTYEMGSDHNDSNSREDEHPKHKVSINGFWMSITEVTNLEFKKFIDETGYITTAEKSIDWEECKK